MAEAVQVPTRKAKNVSTRPVIKGPGRGNSTTPTAFPRGVAPRRGQKSWDAGRMRDTPRCLLWFCEAAAARRGSSPGFPFCLPRMVPLYTREPPIPRNFLRRTIVQLRRPSPQPPQTCNRLEPPTFRAFLRHRSTLVAFLRQAGFVALAARQPPGTGSAQILRSMSPNSRRVRCPSANRSQ